MTKKKALYDAIFVALMGFAFSSFLFWQLFQRIGPIGNDFAPLASMLSITPFVLAGAIGLTIFNVTRQILNSRVETGDAENSTDNA